MLGLRKQGEAVPGRPGGRTPGSAPGDEATEPGRSRQEPDRSVSRREAIRWLGLAAAGIAAAGCTPLRIGLHAWPERFDRLSADDRTAVVHDGLHADGTTRRLYTGAVFPAQVSTYAGIYDAERGCPLIGFEGRYRVRSLDQVTYPSPGRFLAAGATTDGNSV